MLYEPELLVVVSVAIPVATFLAETLALGTTPPCASLMVPDKIAPDTCARSGQEISNPREKLHRNRMHLMVFENIGEHPFRCFVLISPFQTSKHPVSKTFWRASNFVLLSRPPN